MTFMEAIKIKKVRDDFFYWFLFTLLFGLFPIVLGVVVFGEDIITFTENGDIGIFSYSMIVASLYTLTRDSRPILISGSSEEVPLKYKYSPYSRPLQAISYFLLLLSVFLIPLALLGIIKFTGFMHYGSVVLFFGTVLYASFVEIMGNATGVTNLDTDVEAASSNRQEKIEDKMDLLGE